MNETVSPETLNELLEVGFDWAKWQKPPTCIDIIAQMPGATIGEEIGGEWICRWQITEFNYDARYDPCPHECAAKAFLAWKKGLE